MEQLIGTIANAYKVEPDAPGDQCGGLYIFLSVENDVKKGELLEIIIDAIPYHFEVTSAGNNVSAVEIGHGRSKLETNPTLNLSSLVGLNAYAIRDDKNKVDRIQRESCEP